MLSGRHVLYSIGSQVLIAVSILTATTLLGVLDKIDGQAITALFGVAAGLAGATAAVSSSTAQTVPPPVTTVTTREGVVVSTGNGGADGPRTPAPGDGEGA